MAVGKRRASLTRLAAVALAVLAFAVCVLLLPPVQRALVLGLANRSEGIQLELGSVAAGPWGVRLSHLRLQAPGVEVAVERAEVDLAFWASVFGLRLELEDVTASGVELRFRPSAAAAEATEQPPVREAFGGLGPLLRLPGWLVLRHAVAAGRVTAVVTDALELGGPWTVDIADLGSGRTCRAELKGTLEGRRAAEVMLEGAVAGLVVLQIARDGAARALDAHARVQTIEGEPPVGLDANLRLDLGERSEAYNLTLDDSDGRRLIDLKAELTPATRMLGVTWTAATPQGRVAAFARGRAVPDLWGSSSGSMTLALETRRLEVEATATIEAREWARVDGRLADIEQLSAGVEVAGTVEARRLEVRRVRLALVGAGGRELLCLSTLQPLSVDLERWQVTPERWGEPALSLDADRFPLGWARRFDPAAVAEAGTVSASLGVVPVAPQHSRLVADEPIRFAGLRLRAREFGVSPVPVDVVVVPRLELRNGALLAEVERAELTAPTGLRIDFTGLASTARERWPVLSLAGDIALRVPALQRTVRSLDEVAGGARFDLDLQRMILALGTARLTASTVDRRPLLLVELDSESPLELALPSLRPNWEASRMQRLRVRLDGLPIDWLSPFIPEFDIDSGALYGELVASGAGGRGLTLEPLAPFEVRDLRVGYRGQPLSMGARLGLEPRVRLENAQIQVALERIEVRTSEGGRLDGEVTFDVTREDPGRVHSSLWFEGFSPAVADRLGRLGALHLTQRAVLDVANRRLEVTELDLGLTDRAGVRFLEVETLRPFEVTLEPFAVRVEGGSPDILVATITPLQLERLFPEILGLRFEGVLPQGQFFGRATDDGLVLAAEEPLVFRDVSVSWNEAPILDRVTIGLTYEMLYSADGLKARSIELTALGPRGAPIANATLQMVMPLTDRPTLSSLRFDVLANLEPFAQQPLFRGLPRFIEGTLGGFVDVSLGERSTFAGALQLRGARAEDFGAFPDLAANLDVTATAGERLELRAPLRLTSESGTSDITLEGSVTKDGDRYHFDAALIGDRINVPDATRFASFLSRRGESGPAAAIPRTAPAKADVQSRVTALDQLRERRSAAPFWGEEVSGRARLELGSLDFAGSSVTGIRGRLEVDPRRIELADVEANTGDARLAAQGLLTFDPAAPSPYELRFDSSVDDLDVARILRSRAPDVPPTLEGLFAMQMHLAGTGRNPLDLALGTLGDLHLRGRDGIFRGLAGRFGAARTGARVAGFLTFSKELKAIGHLLGELEELRFSTLDVVLARTDPGRFEFADFTVLSPLARIEATGGLEVDLDRPLALSPVDVRVELATGGDLTVLFDGMGLLQPAADVQGYRPLNRPLSVGGTVAEPDTSDFYAMLDEAAANAGGSFGVGLRAINKKLQRSRGQPASSR